MTTEALREQANESATEARAIWARVKNQATADGGRDLTKAERELVQAAMDKAKAAHQKLDGARGDDNMMAELNRLTDGMATTTRDGQGGRSLGQQFVNSEAYRYIRETKDRRPSAWQSPVTELHATTLSEDNASGGPVVLADQQPGILPLATRPLVVSDLIAPGTTTSNLISFMKEKSFTNAAAAVAEAGTKPESTLVFENATSKVEKIAHWIPVTDEILQDVSQMASYVDARMRRGVYLAEDDALLNGSGVSPIIKGFLHLTTPAAPIARVAESNADVILKQISAIELATSLQVDGIVLNPAQWLTILLTKDADGNYIAGGGPFVTPRRPTLWGRNVAITSAIVAGTALVGSFASGGAQLFKHGGIRVDISNSHSDFFIKNLLAVRAEIREALAVYRESAFGIVTNLS